MKSAYAEVGFILRIKSDKFSQFANSLQILSVKFHNYTLFVPHSAYESRKGFNFELNKNNQTKLRIDPCK